MDNNSENRWISRGKQRGPRGSKQRNFRDWKTLAKRRPWRDNPSRPSASHKTPQNVILLGQEVETSEKVYAQEKDRFTHMHILGATGTGKSKFMEGMIRRDILKRRGLCLIDPHGSLYDDVLKFCAKRNLKKRVILFDASEDDYVIGFNPVSREAKDIGFQVDGVVQSVLKAWGQEDTEETPRLARWLRNLAYVLAQQNLTLVESQHMINLADDTLRKAITKQIKSEMVKQEWDGFNKLKARRQSELIESLQNRMAKFLQIERMRRILGQRDHTLNFRKVMDEGYVLLVNLSLGQSISSEHAKMLATLLINQFYMTATQRPKGTKPFYLYIDEFGEFVTRDVAKALDQCRKFGLHLILAHQHLAQLKNLDPLVYYSTMTNTKTKVVFGGLTVEDGKMMVEEMFIGQFNLDEIKLLLEQTKFQPITIHATSRTTGTSRGQVEAKGMGTMESGIYTPMAGFFQAQDQLRQAIGTSRARSEAVLSGDFEAETVAPMTSHMTFKETSAVHFRDLTEQIYRALAIMVNQPVQYALTKIGNNPTKPVKTPTVENIAITDKKMLKFKREVFEYHECYSKPEDVDREITNRRQTLISQAAREEPETYKAQPISFPNKSNAQN